MRLINPTSRPSSPEPYLIGPSQSKCEQPNDESPEARSETNKHELNQIIKQIRAFISGDPESDKLWLRISGGLRDSEELDRALERLRVRSSFQGSTLVVYAGRPVHESLAESVQDWAFLRLIPEVLTPEESKCVSVTGRSMILHGKISGRSRKRQTQEKFPDKAIVMEDPTTGDQFCTVIFEVAFSEAYADLVRDMKQWLLCSDGQVQLVILANIEEDERTLAQRKETDDFKDRAAKFVNDFGTAFGKIIHASLLERLSDPSSQQEGQATEGTKQDSQTMDQPSFGAKVRKANREVKDEDWVGPITVDLEFWELKDSEPRKRGESVVSFQRVLSQQV